MGNKHYMKKYIKTHVFVTTPICINRFRSGLWFLVLSGHVSHALKVKKDLLKRRYICETRCILFPIIYIWYNINWCTSIITDKLRTLPVRVFYYTKHLIVFMALQNWLFICNISRRYKYVTLLCAFAFSQLSLVALK